MAKWTATTSFQACRTRGEYKNMYCYPAIACPGGMSYGNENGVRTVTQAIVRKGYREKTKICCCKVASQLFLAGHQDEIHLINDEQGILKYGCTACFVEEGLYKKIMAEFENEISPTPPVDDPF